jgi:hypothetical protein
MPIPLSNLDDRTYADLVEEAIGRIPLEAPEWTDYNPADTGIVQIELLAWLTEMVLYRLNQIPNANQAIFLSLLKGQPWEIPSGLSSTAQANLLQSEIQQTLAQLRQPYRAVTDADFTQLILHDWLQTKTAPREFGTNAEIARVHCLPERDLDNANIDQVIEAHISLVVLPRHPQEDTTLLRHTLKRFLNQRRLITTHLHIVEPHYVHVTLSATLYLEDGANFKVVLNQTEQRIQHFFAPLDSHEFWDGQGYPFGNDIYLSELYQLLDGVVGVDYVEAIELTGTQVEGDRQKFNEQDQLIGVSIREHELVKIEIGKIKTLQRFGTTWKPNI